MRPKEPRVRRSFAAVPVVLSPPECSLPGVASRLQFSPGPHIEREPVQRPTNNGTGSRGQCLDTSVAPAEDAEKLRTFNAFEQRFQT